MSEDHWKTAVDIVFWVSTAVAAILLFGRLLLVGYHA